MITNYCRILFRHFAKNKSYSLLNILGLAIGIACAGLIFLWVEDEVQYDTFAPKRDQLYWIRENQTYQGLTRTFNSTPPLLGPAMKAEIPGVANFCRRGWGSRPLWSLGEKAVMEDGYSVDPSFFGMFGIQFIEGRAADAFTKLHSLVITEKMARHFFDKGTTAIGKTLRMDNQQAYVISGVIKDLPANSTLQFDWVIPFDVFLQDKAWLMKAWGANSVGTFVELQPDADVNKINQQLYGFIQTKAKDAGARPFLLSMKDWHLRDHFVAGKQTGGRIEYVRLFAIIAWVILLVACINFMNLATARSEKRAHEVGVRKALGAARKSLILQFMGEAMVMAVLAVAAGLVLISLVLPAFNTLVEKQLTVSLGRPWHLGGIMVITLFCGLVAGSYPAIYLSSFRPLLVLKGMKAKGSHAIWIRKGLVVFQFTISIVLIAGTAIVYLQVQHIRSRDLGYDKNHLVSMRLTGTMQKDFDVIRHHLLNTGVVEEAALSSNESFQTNNNTSGYTWEGKDEDKDVLISYRKISPQYIATMGMHLSEGRLFYNNQAADSSSILITESLARQMGKGSAIGKTILDGEDAYRVIGVIKDYVYGDMYGQPDPVVFFYAPQSTNYLYVRYKAAVPAAEALAQIKKVLAKDNPAYPFDYEFVDDQFNEQFASEALIGHLSRLFALLSMVISCLGLFGLAAYTAERRTREIGIRKVLGASVAGITRLLSVDFLKLVLVAAMIAFPLAWWVMHSWLANYAYRITINWWVFAIAGLSAMGIALLTIGVQSVKAALANPVKSLRTE